VVDPYNDAVVTLRKNQYVYLATVERYWDKPVVRQYETFFTDVLDVDMALHAFNDEFSVGLAPKPPELPPAAWINAPKKHDSTPTPITPVCSLIS
jgi:hypothetical protein